MYENILDIKNDRYLLFADLIEKVLEESNPAKNVLEVLERLETKPNYLLAFGKASVAMAEAAFSYYDEYDLQFEDALVVTKKGHSECKSYDYRVLEAAHPVPDKYSILAGEEVLKFLDKMEADSHLLLLISGGASSLVEALEGNLTLEDIQCLTKKLLASAADIVEINTLRKHCSRIKGGKLAKLAEVKGIKVSQVLLSDVLGDRIDVIASGPATIDTSSLSDLKKIKEKYQLDLEVDSLPETVKRLSNVDTYLTSSVKQLCKSADNFLQERGYKTIILTDCLSCEAREAGRFLSAVSQYYSRERKSNEKIALICGGETVVTLSGEGLGGRNQELVLAGAEGLADGCYLLSLGSDGTDGPTDAAGAIASSETWKSIVNAEVYLSNNDSYHALDSVKSLIKTGPTGTNVNDLTILFVE